MSVTATSRTDIAVAAAKGVLGALPAIGPLIAEAVGTFIPNQKIDRLGAFMEALDAKLAQLERTVVEAAFRDPEFLDLLEDGFLQAARALSQERRDHIASLLKNSLTADGVRSLERKRLLSLLGELNDLEILILRYHASRTEADRTAFEKKHPVVKKPLPTSNSPAIEHQREALYESYLLQLTRLGLLRPRYRKPWIDQGPEFDYQTGAIRADGYETTSLGELLLNMIDLLREA